jgi:hypothetical protein
MRIQAVASNRPEKRAGRVHHLARHGDKGR